MAYNFTTLRLNFTTFFIMSKQETPILYSHIGGSFSQLDKKSKLDLLKASNLSLTTYGADQQ